MPDSPSQSGANGARDPLERLYADHHGQAKLCEMLEAIADALPDGVDPQMCRQVLDELGDQLILHHRDEEEGLFPLIEKRALPEDGIAAHLAQLSLEHATDESFAEELREALEECARGGRPASPNTLGYMLRGFFEGYRRHLHWENMVLLPLARKRLTNDDLTHLNAIMDGHRNTGRA